MKICHLTSAHNPEDGRIFLKECTTLAENGHDVYLVERGISYFKNGVHIIGVGDPRKGRLYRMTLFARKVFLAAMRINADVYHIHDPELLQFVGVLKKKGKIVVFDCHESYRLQISIKPYLPRMVASGLAKIYGLFEDKTLKKIDALIVPALGNDDTQYALKCKRVVVLDNFPIFKEIEQFRPRQFVKIPNSVCCLGNLTEDRGISTLVKAINKTNSFLYLAGKFSSPQYEQQVLDLDVNHRVVFLGMLGREGVWDVLTKCCVGISTILSVGQYNKGNNLPTKVYEYMAMSLPVILSSSKYNSMLMDMYKFGICVNPNDEEEIALAITKLSNNTEMAAKMGRNGRQLAENFFSWENESKKLSQLYEDFSYIVGQPDLIPKG